MHGIVEAIKAASPEKVQDVKSRLMHCCDCADSASGFFNDRWRESIKHIDTQPELVLTCNSMLHDLIARLIGHNAGSNGPSA